MRKFKIGVSGSAFCNDPELNKLSFKVGAEIAKSGHIMLYGGGHGYPKQAAKGALSQGGSVISISPAFCLEEHKAFYKVEPEPDEVLVYTGFGFQGRDVIFIRSCDAVININGGEGSLLEYIVGYRNNKIMGLMEGSGGITDHLEQITSWFYKKEGVVPVIVKSKDPVELVKLIIDKLQSYA